MFNRSVINYSYLVGKTLWYVNHGNPQGSHLASCSASTIIPISGLKTITITGGAGGTAYNSSGQARAVSGSGTTNVDGFLYILYSVSASGTESSFSRTATCTAITQ